MKSLVQVADEFIGVLEWDGMVNMDGKPINMRDGMPMDPIRAPFSSKSKWTKWIVDNICPPCATGEPAIPRVGMTVEILMKAWKDFGFQGIHEKRKIISIHDQKGNLLVNEMGYFAGDKYNQSDFQYKIEGVREKGAKVTILDNDLVHAYLRPDRAKQFTGKEGVIDQITDDGYFVIKTKEDQKKVTLPADAFVTQGEKQLLKRHHIVPNAKLWFAETYKWPYLKSTKEKTFDPDDPEKPCQVGTRVQIGKSGKAPNKQGIVTSIHWTPTITDLADAKLAAKKKPTFGFKMDEGNCSSVYTTTADVFFPHQLIGYSSATVSIDELQRAFSKNTPSKKTPSKKRAREEDGASSKAANPAQELLQVLLRQCETDPIPVKKDIQAFDDCYKPITIPVGSRIFEVNPKPIAVDYEGTFQNNLIQPNNLNSSPKTIFFFPSTQLYS